jgi:hypothetical protein
MLVEIFLDSENSINQKWLTEFLICYLQLWKQERQITKHTPAADLTRRKENNFQTEIKTDLVPVPDAVSIFSSVAYNWNSYSEQWPCGTTGFSDLKERFTYILNVPSRVQKGTSTF